MLLDVILHIRDLQDDSLVVRKSCREGVCGSDAIDINGRNGLACVTRVRELREPVRCGRCRAFRSFATWWST